MRIEHMTGGARLHSIKPYQDPEDRLIWCYECTRQIEKGYWVVWINKNNQEVIFTLCPMCMINYLIDKMFEEAKI